MSFYYYTFYILREGRSRSLGSHNNASVPGLPRSVRVLIMRMFAAYIRIIKTRTERGRPGAEAMEYRWHMDIILYSLDESQFFLACTVVPSLRYGLIPLFRVARSPARASLTCGDYNLTKVLERHTCSSNHPEYPQIQEAAIEQALHDGRVANVTEPYRTELELLQPCRHGTVLRLFTRKF